MTVKKNIPSMRPSAESITLTEGLAPTAQLTQACTFAAMALVQMQLIEAPQA